MQHVYKTKEELTYVKSLNTKLNQERKIKRISDDVASGDPDN